jgi:hypothetical protein
MPNEPAESNFKEKIRHPAYPCVERSGVVWTYMGPRTTPPPFPDLEFGALPETHHVAAKITEYCNWLQILEGDLDTVHLDFLHSRLPGFDGPGPGVRPSDDRNPRIEVSRTDYGFVKGARRVARDGNYYWRIYQFLMPAIVMLPAGRDTITYRVTVPIDDEHTTFWNGEYSPSRPLTEEERARHLESRAIGGFAQSTGDPLTRWRPLASPDNDYFLDYAAQKTKLYSGIPPVKLQDVAMTEGMGAILDRHGEHLGTTDAAIVQLRRAMLNAAKALRDFGTVPPGVDQPELYAVRSATAIFPPDANWVDASRDGLKAGQQPILSVTPGR